MGVGVGVGVSVFVKGHEEGSEIQGYDGDRKVFVSDLLVSCRVLSFAWARESKGEVVNKAEEFRDGRCSDRVSMIHVESWWYGRLLKYLDDGVWVSELSSGTVTTPPAIGTSTTSSSLNTAPKRRVVWMIRLDTL